MHARVTILLGLFCIGAVHAESFSLTATLYQIPGAKRGAATASDLSGRPSVANLQSNWTTETQRRLEFRNNAVLYTITVMPGNTAASITASRWNGATGQPVYRGTLPLNRGQHSRVVAEDGYVLDLLAR